MHSLFLSQRRACASSRPLVTPCAAPLVTDPLLCCKTWILHLVAVLFCHKPCTFQGIASYLVAAWHSLNVWGVLSLTLHCDSSTVFSNVIQALWSLATAVNLQKDRYTACLPVHSRSVKQRSCFGLHQRHNTALSQFVTEDMNKAVL